MGKFESYPSISALADDDITLINHNTVTHKISFATLATLIKNRIGLQADNIPTKDSINLATSGGIYSMIKDEENRAISVENTKANQATTLSGYGITDAYTKTEADNKFSTFSGSYNDLINKPTLGTAAAKNSTNAVTSGSADLVESGAVYDFVGKTLTAQTLAVGATTLTFTDSSIGNNSRIRVISNPFTSGLLNAVQNGNTVTLTFDAQEVALSVTLEVRN